ncbi:methyltransferase [Porifericola rhodea]|uniref:methyltransferase n=1 Tax=Porifericola rhodea TaxID=930972 RepID=UPI0026658666|nr:methyltransferase [Porifericola rhodea]WKN30869.1 methyltransferase [Porifericola rhodea]
MQTQTQEEYAEHSMSHETAPVKIMQIGTGFWASKVLLSAVHFDLFTLLSEQQSLSAADVKKKLQFQCADRQVFDYLDALVALGFLKRKGLLESAKYSNTEHSEMFLDKKKNSYVGGMLKMMNQRLYHFWGNLEQGLTSGKPQNEAKENEDIFSALYNDADRLSDFLRAMNSLQIGNFIAFAKKFDFSKYTSLTDVGGASGLLSVMVAKHNPHIKCVSFDLPEVEPIASKTISKFDMEGKVSLKSGNFFRDPIPEADVVIMGNILHDWNEEQKLKLMKSAYNAVKKGGVFVAIENIIDRERKENLFGLMMSLNMLIETGQGFDYTLADFDIWAKKVGFSSTTMIPLAGPTSAAIAYK